MNIPTHHYDKSNALKAFVLGCDPTAFSKKDQEKYKSKEIQAEDRQCIPFDKVFGIDGKDKRYFSGIKINLEELNLGLKHVYVQNLVREYQHYLTSENKAWKSIAAGKILERKREFDKIDPTHKLPVFLTSYTLYEVLLNDDEVRMSPFELYHPGNGFLIPANKNKLCRPLFPFFRHYKYSMKRQVEYKEKIKLFLCSTYKTNLK